LVPGTPEIFIIHQEPNGGSPLSKAIKSFSRIDLRLENCAHAPIEHLTLETVLVRGEASLVHGAGGECLGFKGTRKPAHAMNQERKRIPSTQLGGGHSLLGKKGHWENGQERGRSRFFEREKKHLFSKKAELCTRRGRSGSKHRNKTLKTNNSGDDFFSRVPN